MAFPVGPQRGPVRRRLGHRRRAVAGEGGQVVQRARAVRLQQQVGRCRAASGGARPACPADQEVQPGLGEELGREQAGHGGQGPPGRAAWTSASPASAVIDGDRVTRPRDQPEPGPGDDRERAFRPGQQRRVVIAGVVLDQAGQVRHDGAVGQHGLDAAQLGPHRAVAQDPQPARVGGDGAADRGAVPAGDQDAEVQVGVGRPDLAQRDPGPGGDLARRRGRLAQPVSRARLSTTSPCSGTPPPTSPVLPPCGTTGTPARCTGQHGGDLLGVARPHDRGRVGPGTGRSSPRRSPAVASPVSTCGAPTTAARSRSRAGGRARARGAGHRGYLARAGAHGPGEGVAPVPVVAELAEARRGRGEQHHAVRAGPGEAPLHGRVQVRAGQHLGLAGAAGVDRGRDARAAVGQGQHEGGRRAVRQPGGQRRVVDAAVVAAGDQGHPAAGEGVHAPRAWAARWWTGCRPRRSRRPPCRWPAAGCPGARSPRRRPAARHRHRPRARPARAGRPGRSGRCAGCACRAGRAGSSSRRPGHRRRAPTRPAGRAGRPAPAAGRCRRWRWSAPHLAGSTPTACPGSRSPRRRASAGDRGAARSPRRPAASRPDRWPGSWRSRSPSSRSPRRPARVPGRLADVAADQAPVAPPGEQVPGDGRGAALALGAGDAQHPVPGELPGATGPARPRPGCRAPPARPGRAGSG